MELIGQGGVWNVYNIENQNYIFRIPKGFTETTINKFIENYSVIKNLGFPTLEQVEKYEINGIVGVICNNLNCSDEKLYVTYNSLYSDSHKLTDFLSKDILGIKAEKKSSLAEDFRYNNKIDELTNFKEFIINIKSDLKLATKQDVLIEFDSYFFGTQKQKTITTIDYKIADLDNIFTNTNIDVDELFDLNISEFLRAINGFIRYFVTEKNRYIYLDYIKTNSNYF